MECTLLRALRGKLNKKVKDKSKTLSVMLGGGLQLHLPPSLLGGNGNARGAHDNEGGTFTTNSSKEQWKITPTSSRLT